MFEDSFDPGTFDTQRNTLLSDTNFNQALMDSLPFPAMLIRKDRRVLAVNKTAKDIGVEVGTFCWDTFGKKASIPEEDRKYYEMNNSVPPQGIKCTFCRANEALSTQKPVNVKIPADDIFYDTFWIPLADDVYLHYAIIQQS